VQTGYVPDRDHDGIAGHVCNDAVDKTGIVLFGDVPDDFRVYLELRLEETLDDGCRIEHRSYMDSARYRVFTPAPWDPGNTPESLPL